MKKNILVVIKRDEKFEKHKIKLIDIGNITIRNVYFKITQNYINTTLIFVFCAL